MAEGFVVGEGRAELPRESSTSLRVSARKSGWNRGPRQNGPKARHPGLCTIKHPADVPSCPPFSAETSGSRGNEVSPLALQLAGLFSRPFPTVFSRSIFSELFFGAGEPDVGESAPWKNSGESSRCIISKGVTSTGCGGVASSFSPFFSGIIMTKRRN